MFLIKRFSISLEEIKSYVLLLFICGWILPKINVSGFNLGAQDIAAIVLVLFRFKINLLILKFFIADLVFAIFLFLLGSIYLFNNDIEGFLIGSRTLLFVIAVLSFTSISYTRLVHLMKIVTNIYLIFITISVVRILINLLLNPFDIINFFYGSDSFRVRAPFESEGSASSQVPVGYMIALILTTPLVARSRFRKLIFILGAIGTTSRASILSIVLVFFKKINLKKKSAIFTLLILVSLGYIAFLKSFTANDGALDGSANKRLELYSNSIKIMLSNPISLIRGFGLSTSSLAAATGEGFYESFVVNSFMQGGLILLIFSIWILVKAFYFDFKYKIYSISIVVFLGNVIGGSNYFSMFAYPLMGLIVSIAVMNNKNKSIGEKNPTSNYIK